MRIKKINMKKAQAGLGIGIIVLLSITIIGIFGTYKTISDNRYVLDISTNTVYDLSKCSISDLEENNIKYVENGDYDAEGYTMAECSR